MTEATKHDLGKPRMGLISSIFLNGLATVLTFGAKKYDAHNWRKGFKTSRPYDALQRHLIDWNDGQDYDRESGLHLLDHAACELMFLRELVFTHAELDDRYKAVIPAVATKETFDTKIGLCRNGMVPCGYCDFCSERARQNLVKK